MNIDEDTLQTTNADEAPATKRVAKKAAKKTTAKKAAAKKTTTRKKASEAELPLETPEPAQAAAPVIEEAAPAKPRRAAKKVAKAVEGSAEAIAPPAPQPELKATPSAEDEPRRIGRVPGGGRLVTKKQPASESDAPQQAPVSEQSPAPQQNNFQEENRHGKFNQETNESRSKRRREKRKRRREQNRLEQGERREGQGGQGHQSHNKQRDGRESRHQHNGNNQHEQQSRQIALNGPKVTCDGMLELAPKGFGFLRVPNKNFEQARDDVFVTPETIRRHNLRVGQWIHGSYQEGPRGPQLVDIDAINGITSEEASKLPHFDELKAINPSKRISFETTPDRYTTRVVDIMAPVGRGQRGLIVSPPRSGKTTLLLHMAEAVREKYDEAIHLMIVLIDERPEEVTEFRRALPGVEIYASSNDEQARSHCRIAELAIERAKRLVEAGKDVFLLMDSITRLARAYNGGMNHRGRGVGSGGITIGALEVPRRLFAAARNTRGGGSLTILATALVQTNSRADEAIFMEFKGTGNMELVLDRKIAENYIYPAVDIFKSGTRREELLIPDHMLHKIHLIRRGLSGHRPVEAMERLLFFQKKFPNNPQMLLEIKG